MDAQPRPSDSSSRLGVLAFGDSITNGGGELQWGVALQSWALWTARGLGLPFTSFASDGARAADVVSLQIPRHSAESAIPGACYHLGTLYIGVNDVRDPGWDPAAYEHEVRSALAYLSERCDTILALTIPTALGRPRTDPRRIDAANAIVVAEADACGALLLDLRGFGARNQVMADRVHPTAFGQIAIAERALSALEPAGCGVRVWPHTLISPRSTRWQRLRGDLSYGRRSAMAHLRSESVRKTLGTCVRKCPRPRPRPIGMLEDTELLAEDTKQ